MSTAPDAGWGDADSGAVELLERSLGYTRVVLAGVTDDHLGRRTPCRSWDLAQLLDHMDDALDAFTEAAGGAVEVRRRSNSAHARVSTLTQKACALLGAWNGPRPSRVSVGGIGLASEFLVAAAALEITVHGWDVSRTAGSDRAIPPGLARDLLSVARSVVHPQDRGVRFARPRPVLPGAPHDVRLLGFLGRGVG